MSIKKNQKIKKKKIYLYIIQQNEKVVVCETNATQSCGE